MAPSSPTAGRGRGRGRGTRHGTGRPPDTSGHADIELGDEQPAALPVDRLPDTGNGPSQFLASDVSLRQAILTSDGVAWPRPPRAASSRPSTCAVMEPSWSSCSRVSASTTSVRTDCTGRGALASTF